MFFVIFGCKILGFKSPVCVEEITNMRYAMTMMLMLMMMTMRTMMVILLIECRMLVHPLHLLSGGSRLHQKLAAKSSPECQEIFPPNISIQKQMGLNISFKKTSQISSKTDWFTKKYKNHFHQNINNSYEMKTGNKARLETGGTISAKKMAQDDWLKYLSDLG